MTNLEKLKQRILEAKKMVKPGGITIHEQHFLVALAQDKYYRKSTGDEFIDQCVEKYKTKILEGLK